MYNPKYCLFYDNHTMPTCPDVGENFDVEWFTDRIKDCGVDHLTFHARCNMGMAYYDTKIGIKHPSLKYDLFGKLAESCQRKNISLSAYFNGGISSEEGLRHRDWTTLYFDGREYTEPRMSPYVRTMCYNSPYHDHLVSMVREVAQNYPVSGFFIDCMASYPCVCPTCVKEMKERGIDWNDETAVTEFSKFSAVRLARDIAEAVQAVDTDFLLYFNNLSKELQAEFCTYSECECLPTAGWGYEFLPMMSHYLRTLGDKPVLNMNARFYDWGDFGGLRSEASMKSELLYGLANGMRPNIGGHFHPRGDAETAVFDRIEKIYKELQTMEPWFKDAKPLTEIAIVSTADQVGYSKGLSGAIRMLSELKQQFDIVTDFCDWEKYRLLVIPDDVLFDEEITQRVKAHLAAGKTVISSGISGMNPEKTGFVLEDEWGVLFQKECDFDPAYFTVGATFGTELPKMPLSLYASGIEMKALPGTSEEAHLIKPYYNRHWDGEHAFYYNPPDKTTELPALTLCGNVAHFSHRIFSGYQLQAPIELRQLFANVLKRLLPDPMVRTENLPSFARVFVTRQSDRKMVHVLSYLPELRGEKTQIIEEPISINDARIALRNDLAEVNCVYTAPNRKQLGAENRDGYTCVDIPVVNGYALLVFEGKYDDVVA